MGRRKRGGRRRTPPAVVYLSRDGTTTEPPPWSLPEGLRAAIDTSPARWIEERLPRYRWATVGAIIPEGFEAYARILHPAYRGTGPDAEAVPWATVAAETGGVIHPHVQFGRVAHLGDDVNEQPPWGRRPHEGDLPEELVGPLRRVLPRFTATADRCWFCVWYGYAELTLLEGIEDYPLVETPGREYLLLEGTFNMVSFFGGSMTPLSPDGPNIWWPDDRAWCVATEIDLDSTYVGGSAALIRQLTDDPDLEVLPAKLEDSVDIGSDTINT